MTTPPDSTRAQKTGPEAEELAPEKEREAPARLSLTQIVASALAAVSTTVLLSYFGTAGTIIGAGVASALTVVANYVYTRSIQKTRDQLVPVVGKVVQATTGTSVPRDRSATARITVVPRGAESASAAEPDATSVRRTTSTDVLGEDPTAVPRDATSGTRVDAPVPDADPADATDPPSAWLRLIDRCGRGRVLTVTALALFVVVMGVVLVVELAIGKPISDAVRGTEGSGTTIGRDRSTEPSAPTTPAPAPSSPAEDPANVPTPEPTDTSTTPPPTEEPTTPPTDEPTDEPAPDPITPPSPEPTPTPGTGETEEGSGSGTGAEHQPGTGTGGSAEPVPTPTATSGA